MITVKVNEYQLVDLLLDRVEYWTDDPDVYRLFDMMYTNYAEGGCFDGCELDIKAIVDNDYINYCSVISEGDEAYEDIKKIYEENDFGDISCEENNHGYSFIEAEYEGLFLVRS